MGIDSIKQAEIMAELRGKFGIPVDDTFQLREYPTLGHVIGYIASFGDAEAVVDSVIDEPSIEEETISEEIVEETTVSAPVTNFSKSVVEGVLDVVVEHTGYPAEFLEMDADMEGELGICSKH